MTNPGTHPHRHPRALLALGAVLLSLAGCGGGDGGASTAGDGGAGGGSAAASTQAQAVRFAQCVRGHGVPDFPDPDASGRLTIDAVANDAGVDVQSATFEQAVRACRDLEPAGFTGGKRTPKQQTATLRFAACIRAHGVTDFPDPAEGQAPVDTRRIPSANRPGGMDVLNAAMKQCAGKLDLAAGGQR